MVIARSDIIYRPHIEGGIWRCDFIPFGYIDSIAVNVDNCIYISAKEFVYFEIRTPYIMHIYAKKPDAVSALMFSVLRISGSRALDWITEINIYHAECLLREDGRVKKCFAYNPYIRRANHVLTPPEGRCVVIVGVFIGLQSAQQAGRDQPTISKSRDSSLCNNFFTAYQYCWEFN